MAMIKMKKLVSSGVPGANEGYVRRGREFEVPTEHRAKELEDAGLAYRVEVKALAPEPLNKMIESPANEAASSGPLGSVGGTTGAETLVPSSPQGHQPRQRRSPRSKGADLLS